MTWDAEFQMLLGVWSEFLALLLDDLLRGKQIGEPETSIWNIERDIGVLRQGERE